MRITAGYCIAIAMVSTGVSVSLADEPVMKHERIGQIFGSTTSYDTAAGITVFNDNFMGVNRTDLGPVTFYDNKLWFSLGDTFYDPGATPGMHQFIVGYSSDLTLNDGVIMDGYISLDTNWYNQPRCAISPEPNYPIPNAMFTVKWQGQEYMFGQYMEVITVGGHNHKAWYSQIVKYDPNDQMFHDYKAANRWNESSTPDGQYHFGMASFHVDYEAGYLYMVGSPVHRFGGVRLARIPLASFMDPNDSRFWEYYLGNDNWSSPTNSTSVINDQAVWLIEPKDPEWSLNKNYDDVAWSEQTALVTIGEFSLVYNPYLKKFMILNAIHASPPYGGVWYYTADNLTGPWSDAMMLMPNQTDAAQTWKFYGAYTTDALLERNGQRVHFIVSTWIPYNIYHYAVEFDNCADVENPGQADADNDGYGDACDNCPNVDNFNQTDYDSDGIGDVCDDDDDNDSVLDFVDNCPMIANSTQIDTDADGIGDACDSCADTVVGAAIDATGCPLPIPGDIDNDGDVDQQDFGRFQICYSGQGVMQLDTNCLRAMMDADSDVDIDDFGLFVACMSGSDMPGNPACDD